jgi:chromosome segregation ATPase
MEDVQHCDADALLSAAQPFDTALYLGPGLRALAQSLSDRHAKHLIAFTDVKAHRSFSTQGAGELSIVTQPTLVTPSGKETGIHSYNVQGFNSLRPATRLREIFPGLREGPQIPVETITLSTALEEAGLKGSGNLLILGTNGYEADILQALAQSDSLSLFDRIILPLPSLPFYENSRDGTSLAAMMEAHCYRHGGEDPSDPDMPIAAFDLDHSRLADRAALAERDRDIAVLTDRLDRLTSDLKEVQTQRNAAKSEAESLGTALETLQAQHDMARAELGEVETSVETAQTEKESIAQKLEEAHSRATELEQQIETLKQERSEAVAEREETRAALTNLRSEHDMARTKLGDTQASLEAAQKEKETTARQLDEARSKATELEQQIKTLKTAHEEAHTKASGERDADRETFTSLRSEHDAAGAKIGELQASLETVQKERDDTARELEQAWAKARELEQHVETLKTGHEGALKKARQEAESIRQTNAKSDQDLTLALRLQGLREADLNELKKQYQSLKQENDHLSDLLRTTLHTLDFLRGQKRGGKKPAKRT